jgi:S-formylglutathione hydrolase FrmB
MRRVAAALGTLALAAGLLGVPAAVGGRHASAAVSPFPDCAPATATPTLVVGSVSCLLVHGASLGGDDPVSYYVPPACDPVLGRRCPVLYLLHGFGGDYHGMLGTAAKPSGWVKALAAGPPVDPRAVPDPWNYPPETWVPKPALDLILIAPHGRTLPGGFGPVAGLDSFWTDWNPRYATGGDSPKYATPPPRFSTFLTDELLPYVEAHFPTASGREWRAIAGTSLGGYGSYKNGLQHPDLWTSMGSVSGAHNFLFAPGVDPGPTSSPVGLQPPVATGYVQVPGTAASVPMAALPSQAQGFGVALLALGDPAADHAFYRGNMPRDLAMNGQAYDAGQQSLYIKGFSNDTVPRRTQDASDVGGIAFEDIVLPMNVDMELAFSNEGVKNDYDLHPGIHSDPYRWPWLREQLEAQYARVAHADGTGTPTPAATRFSYRTISTDFSVWGWHVRVARSPVEFLNLRDVTCRGITLQGTGVVTLTVPDACPVPAAGSRTLSVDLGPSMPADEPAGLGATPAYGRTVTLDLTRV